MLQELAWRVDGATVVVEQPNLPNHATVPDLDDPHGTIFVPNAVVVREARPTSFETSAELSR